MTINPVIWFEIHVQDMSRARAFYEEVFQIKLERLKSHIDMWGFPMAMERTGAGGALVYMEGVESGGTGTTVYFACADCATEAGRAASSGGRLHLEKTAIGEYGFIAKVVDTEGNIIGLHSMQ